MSRQIFDFEARGRALRPLGEAIQQPGGEQPDETEDPSDFCDFGYDVVGNADPQSDRQSAWYEAVQEAS